VRALGIDVGVGKGLDLVLMDERRVPLRVVPRVGLERLAGLIDDLTPDVIAIDSPPGWASRGTSRLTERTLAELNIHSFNTPAAANGRGIPFFEWMEVGFRVFRTAARAGFPRYAAGDPRGTAMEVFPHGSATVLTGCLRPKGVRKRTWREGVLRAHGVQTDELRSADLVDAGLCALTGLISLQGKHFAPGDPREGVIVLPVVTLPARPYLACSEEAVVAATPLFHFCGCGDPGCQELTRAEFAPGHDAKRKSMLWRGGASRP
jgi:predicted RNase H-like nuclease